MLLIRSASLISEVSEGGSPRNSSGRPSCFGKGGSLEWHRLAPTQTARFGLPSAGEPEPFVSAGLIGPGSPSCRSLRRRPQPLQVRRRTLRRHGTSMAVPTSNCFFLLSQTISFFAPVRCKRYKVFETKRDTTKMVQSLLIVLFYVL